MMHRRDFLTLSAAAAAALAAPRGAAATAGRPTLARVSETFVTPEWLSAMDAAVATSDDRGDQAFWRAFLKTASPADALRPGLVTLPAPGVELLPPHEARAMARLANDQLAALTVGRRGSTGGLATVSARDPEAGREAARAIDKLGLAGLALGANRGVRLNDPRLWPLYDIAQGANVPLYLPARYAPSTRDAPYRARGAAGILAGAAADSAAHANQLIFGGVLDAFPRLTVVLARLGEGTPYWHAEMVRTCEALRGGGRTGPRREAADYFRTNILLTPADMTSADTAAFCSAVIGSGRVLQG